MVNALFSMSVLNRKVEARELVVIASRGQQIELAYGLTGIVGSKIKRMTLASCFKFNKYIMVRTCSSFLLLPHFSVVLSAYRYMKRRNFWYGIRNG